MKPKLRCNRCGKFVDLENDKQYHGKEIDQYCRRLFKDHRDTTWSCSGQIYAWKETFNLYDKVVHPDILSGKEVFTVIDVATDRLKVKGDFSGIGHPDQSDWFDDEGWIVHSRVKWLQVLPDMPVNTSNNS